MSTDLVEKINARLRDEIEQAGMSLAEAARAAGEKSPQRVKDVVSGKQRCPIDLLARLDGTGVDVFYVLTGKRISSATVDQSVVSYGPASVTPLPLNDSGLLTQQEVLAIVLDAMYQARKHLPAKAVQALVDTAMQLQRAGLPVNKSALETQLRAVK